MNFLYLLVISLLTTALAAAQPVIVAPTPPMGWTSNMAPGASVLETNVRTNAEYLAQNLKQHGWQYVIVDTRWSYPNPPEDKGGNPNQSRRANGAYFPLLAMDAHGRLLPDIGRFPSAKGGLGLRPLATYLHGLGLKFGLHVMRGIPRQAIRAKTPILGTNGITADQIADTVHVCPWLNHMYGIDMSKPGAQAYYNSLLELYGQWNVDYLLFDDMGQEGSAYYASEAEAVRKALDNLHRPILLGISPAQPLDESEHLRQQANLFVLPGEPAAGWVSLKKQIAESAQWNKLVGIDHWPTAGTLRVNYPVRRSVGSDPIPLLSEAEQRTQMTFWCLLKAALLAGGNLAESTPIITNLLTNSEALAINQWAINGKQLSHTNDLLIWMSDAPDGQTKNVAIFNLSDEARTVNLDLRQLGIFQKANIRDVWNQAYKGQFKKVYSSQINMHDAVLLRVTSIQ